MKRIFIFLLMLLPSSFKIFILKVIFKAKIGKNVKIGFGTVLFVNNLEIGDYSRIGMFNYIRCNRLTLGRHVQIGNRTYISVNTLKMSHRTTISSRVDITGSHDANGTVEMGMYSWIFPYCYVNAACPVRLGKNVGVGGGSYIFTHGFWLSKLDGYPVAYAEVTIDDDTWLPWGCFIMPGVHIGKHVVVGARSVVTKSVPDYALVAGSPAKVIREKSNKDLTFEEKADILHKLIQDYGSSRGSNITVEHKSRDINYLFDGKVFIVVHEDITEPIQDRGVLNIFWRELPAHVFDVSCSWSLTNYTSSSEKEFSTRIMDFFVFARKIGLRFYPVDEL